MRGGLGLVTLFLSAAVVLAVFHAPLSAQTAPPDPPAPSSAPAPVEEPDLTGAQRHGIFLDDLDVRLLRLGVTARDARGRPVTDLTAADFRVFRNGEEIPLAGFQEPGTPSPGTTPDETPDETFFVVLLDEAYLETPTRRRLARRLSEELPALLDAGGRILIARQRRSVRVEQTFTRDPILLQRAVDRFAEAAPDLEASAWDEDRVVRSLMRDSENLSSAFESARAHARALGAREQSRLDALGRFLASLSVLPGPKAVIHVSSGFLLNPTSPLLYSDLNDVTGPGSVRQAELESTHHHLRTALAEVVAGANSSGSSFFALHLPREERSREPRRTLGGQRMDRSPGNDGSRGQSLLLLAEGTAGAYHRGLQQLDELLARLHEELAHRYGLFVGAGVPDPETLHRIRVETTRKGVRLAYLDSYRDKSADSRVADATLAALFFDLASNPLDARIELGEATRDGKIYSLPMTVKVPLDRLILLPEAHLHRGRLSVFVASRDAQGNISEPWRQDVPVTLSNEELITTITRSARYLTELRLPPGPHKIAIGVRDELAAVGSTFNIQLHIGASADRTAEVP